jgi:hypothetical protein
MKPRSLIFIFFLIISLAGSQLSAGFSADFKGQNEEVIGNNRSGSNKINILYSLVLPGAGQWNMGYHNRAKFFLGTEFLLWVGYAGFNVIQDNYNAYASVHGDVNGSGKNDQYWIDIGSADNIYGFNERKLRERADESIYPETTVYYWQWDSRESRRSYNNLRVKEHDWQQRATFVVGAFILNRVVSAVDVIRLIRRESRANDHRVSRMYFNYDTNQAGSGIYQLNLTVRW